MIKALALLTALLLSTSALAANNTCEQLPPPETLTPQIVQYLGGPPHKIIKLDEEQKNNITKAYNAAPPPSNETFDEIVLMFSMDNEKAVLFFYADGKLCHVGPIDAKAVLRDMLGGDPA